MKTNHSFLLTPIFALLAIAFSNPTFAQVHIGTLTSLKGDVKILSRKGSSGSKVLRYEGQTYKYKKARIGRKVRPKEIILTGPSAKAKVVFPNGDHFHIGPGSSMTVPAKRGSKASKGSHLKLYYGKVRALISKKGPRKNLILRSKTAVAGVRGTDFFFSESGVHGTKLTVLRGSVALAKHKSEKITGPIQQVERKLSRSAVTVKKGVTAVLEKEKELPPTTEIAPMPAVAVDDSGNIPDPSRMAKKKASKVRPEEQGIVLKPVTKETLIDAHTVTTIHPGDVEPEPIDESVKKEIEALHQKSHEVVMDDIKEEDPELFKKLKKNKTATAKEVHKAVVAKMFKEAPREKVKKKVSEDALKDMESVYKKYFKND